MLIQTSDISEIYSDLRDLRSFELAFSLNGCWVAQDAYSDLAHSFFLNKLLTISWVEAVENFTPTSNYPLSVYEHLLQLGTWSIPLDIVPFNHDFHGIPAAV